MANEPKTRFSITVENGKYTFRTVEGVFGIFIDRYGEKWTRLELASKAIIAMMYELDELRSKVNQSSEVSARAEQFRVEITYTDGYSITFVKAEGTSQAAKKAVSELFEVGLVKANDEVSVKVIDANLPGNHPEAVSVFEMVSVSIEPKLKWVRELTGDETL